MYKKAMKPFFRFLATLPRLFPAFVEAGGVPEHLFLEKSQSKLMELSLRLRLATCYARTAELLALLEFEG
jgi:hypothetical protein